MESLANELRDARARTLALTLDLDDAAWMGPRLAIVNPMRWELGHVAWFEEFWTLRHVLGASPLRTDGDALYDSARVAHDTRWDLPLPDREETLAYMEEVLARTIDTLPRAADPYFHRLALFHEDMHGEALAYTRQTLAYPRPPIPSSPAPPAGPLLGDASIPGGELTLGALGGREPFVFDNEKWAHPVTVAPFRIARAPVTNEEFAAFVRDRGYEDRRLWGDDGWRWRQTTGAARPVYWEPDLASMRRYDGVEPLAEHHPVIHVSWFEAEAYCAWAGRRLPSEAEWELAACGLEKRRFPWGDAPPTSAHANLDMRAGGTVDTGAHAEGDSPFGCRQMIGNVWEWTSSDFGPYPGFTVDPYKEYSAPWFASPHKVLRGGCWVTRARLLRGTWRNFYPPDRRDVLAGFRTCAT